MLIICTFRINNFFISSFLWFQLFDPPAPSFFLSFPKKALGVLALFSDSRDIDGVHRGWQDGAVQDSEKAQQQANRGRSSSRGEHCLIR